MSGTNSIVLCYLLKSKSHTFLINCFETDKNYRGHANCKRISEKEIIKILTVLSLVHLMNM
jgi:hypothetical protein